MLKKVQIHILPTNKDAAFFINKKYPELFQIGDNTVDNPKWQGQHLYFTSDEKPDPQDWCIGILGSLLRIPKSWIPSGDWRKVVATTNPELWYSNERTERGKFENLSREEGIHKANFKPTSISRIPLDFIKEYVEQEGNIKEVELEMEEEPKLGWTDQLKLHSDGTVIIHNIEEKMYTRREVGDMLWKEHMYVNDNISTREIFDEWFDKNYPK